MNKNNILDLPQNNNSSSVEPGTLPNQSSLGNNGNGGSTMNNKYVTHEELKQAVDNLNNKIDTNTEKILHQMELNFKDVENKFETENTKFETINTKFEKQKVWILTTAISLTVSACTVIGFLIKILN